MSRPLIGISKPDSGGLIQNLAIQLSLWIVGARSVNITPSKPSINKNIQGLVLSGGTDISPLLYNNTDIKENYSYDHERDQLELTLLKYAKDHNLPILCICRGAQLLNVFEGGTLFTDIRRIFADVEYPTSILAKIFFRKKIVINENSKLADAFGLGEVEVNSLHTQSIDSLGDDLEVTSREDNGIVQSVEHTKKQYIVGVQFHPELLIYRKDARSLFSNFVDECKKSSLRIHNRSRRK